MLSRVIEAILQEKGRVIVPDLGMFVKRPDGRVLFSELMREDDGAMRSALAAGRGETEAQQLIEEFVAGVNKTLNRGLSYRLEGFGVLSLDDRGGIVFHSKAATEPAPEPKSEPAPEPELQPVQEPQPAPQPELQPVQEPEPAPQPVPAPEPKPQPQPEQQPAPQPQPAPAPKPAPAPQPQPQPAPKTTQLPKSEPEPERVHRPRHGARRKPRRKFDLFLIVTICVIAAAIGVLFYGLWIQSKNSEPEMVPETVIEQPQETPAEEQNTAAENAENSSEKSKSAKNETKSSETAGTTTRPVDLSKPSGKNTIKQ